jgi:hypothetical protein
MALIMARPWKDPRSGVWHLRQRVPQDLIHLKGQNVTLPVGGISAAVKIGAIVQISLRTKDTREAKERHSKADAALRKFWDSQRAGPIRLTQKQALALAGTLYDAFAKGFENNPGSPETWAWVQDVNERAREGRLARLIHSDPSEIGCAILAGGFDRISGMPSPPPGVLLGG